MLKNSVLIGVCRIGGDVKVKFLNIGSILFFIIFFLDGIGNWVYDNGVIGVDVLGVGGSWLVEMNNVDMNGDGVFDVYRLVSMSIINNIWMIMIIICLDMGGGCY